MLLFDNTQVYIPWKSVRFVWNKFVLCNRELRYDCRVVSVNYTGKHCISHLARWPITAEMSSYVGLWVSIFYHDSIACCSYRNCCNVASTGGAHTLGKKFSTAGRTIGGAEAVEGHSVSEASAFPSIHRLLAHEVQVRQVQVPDHITQGSEWVIDIRKRLWKNSW